MSDLLLNEKSVMEPPPLVLLQGLTMELVTREVTCLTPRSIFLQTETNSAFEQTNKLNSYVEPL